ncbi:hypothetical protein MMC18_008856 [Xylographa bjoerkii]|nr:hypothetical protein [Xylographa bjoerkii]MCJ1395970.1 hypothetical protein [Xylographa bjoerkii]
MQLKEIDTSSPVPAEGPLQGPEKPYKGFLHHSGSLPFGQPIALSEISGPTYLTAQTLIQQVAYTLSDRLWTYSPETFDLDVAVKSWYKGGEANANGYPTNVEAMQIRSGAASVALGYIFSPDFDLKKRHIPQSIIASSSSLRYLRAALDQLSLLHSVTNPFVAHIAAVDYMGGRVPGLVTDYVSALSLAEELGFSVVSSLSAYESQHMSLLATLFASVVPTIHIYDGLRVGRETTRIIDVLNKDGLSETYQNLLKDTAESGEKYTGLDNKVSKLLRAFNSELGTDYGLFEYNGHAAPESVLVTFGSIESSLASQVARSLERDGAKVGVINVRIYRPFVEEEFIRLLPKSVKNVGVLGQVKNQYEVSDSSVRSNLFGDVIAALMFTKEWSKLPTIIDVKYPREQVWTPIAIAAAFQLLSPKPFLQQDSETPDVSVQEGLQILDSTSVEQFTFWNLDESTSGDAAVVIGQALSTNSSNNVTVKTTHDNLLQGGVNRTDVRTSKKTVDAPYAVDAADMIYIGDERLLNQLDVLKSIRTEGKVILRLPGIKDDDVEKKLPTNFRKTLTTKKAQFFILDSSAIESVADDASLESYLVQLAFVRLSRSNYEPLLKQKLSDINGNKEIIDALAGKLVKALRSVEVPENWATLEEEQGSPLLPVDIMTNSFAPFDKIEQEPPTFLRSWQTVAKGLAFKEAFGSSQALRPNLPVKTYTVRVRENRRLTPLSYDRNIFHIEFDLGTSGLQYEIGEALGVHAHNDEKEVQDFIDFYKLNPEEIVEVPSRDDIEVLENRTVYQALIQDVDIFGRPPKRFYESLADFAEDPVEKKNLLSLAGLEGVNDFKRRAEVDTITFADVLAEFASAKPSFHDLVRIVSPMKRREYSIASCQKVTPTAVALMIVTVDWVDPKGRNRFGQATRYLNKLRPGTTVTVSVKPSVMKLPTKSTDPLIMAGLGTGLAPFRAFVQHRAWEKAQGIEIGPVLLYMGSRHKREEYCYGEEWEAYKDAGVITLLGCAFSRDQVNKIYIQDRMRETLEDINDAYLAKGGSFYLCGPTWPVPDVTNVLEEGIARDAKKHGKKIDTLKEIERLKDQGRYVLEVY